MSDPIVHLRCERTGRVYRVVGFDTDKKEIRLRGKNGEFVEPLRPVAELKQLGYERVIGAFDGMIEV